MHFQWNKKVFSPDKLKAIAVDCYLHEAVDDIALRCTGNERSNGKSQTVYSSNFRDVVLHTPRFPAETSLSLKLVVSLVCKRQSILALANGFGIG